MHESPETDAKSITPRGRTADPEYREIQFGTKSFVVVNNSTHASQQRRKRTALHRSTRRIERQSQAGLQEPQERAPKPTGRGTVDATATPQTGEPSNTPMSEGENRAMESETPTTTDTATAGQGPRRGRRALLRRAKAVGIPTLDNEDLAAIIDHRCATYMQRRKRLPRLRDAGAEDYGDPGRLRLAAAIELGRRTLAETEKQEPLGSPRKTAAYLIRRYGSLPVEHIGALLLDSRKRVLEGGDVVLGRGSLDETVAEPRDILRAVLRAASTSFVLWHNHPSGDPTPSEEDLAMTERLRTAVEIIGIELLDHVVVTEACYYSFLEHGRV